jgi:hypothetical protein
LKPDSPADRSGLRVGDQIIDVNGQTFHRITQDDAVRVIKESMLSFIANRAVIKFTVRYLGKVPNIEASGKSVDAQVLIDKNTFLLANKETLISEVELNNLINNKQVIASSNSSTIRELLSGSFVSNTTLHINMFKYFLNDYLKYRISVQYFLYLIKSYFKSPIKVSKSYFIFILFFSYESFKFLLV